MRSTIALWHRRLVLPPAGDFSPRKSPQNAPGAAAPGPLWGCAACILRSGNAEAVWANRPVVIVPWYPIRASRRPVKSPAAAATKVFSKAAPTAPERGAAAARGSSWGAFVGADAHIGPNSPEAGHITANAPATQPNGRAIRAPTVKNGAAAIKTGVCGDKYRGCGGIKRAKRRCKRRRPPLPFPYTRLPTVIVPPPRSSGPS